MRPKKTHRQNTLNGRSGIPKMFLYRCQNVFLNLTFLYLVELNGMRLLLALLEYSKILQHVRIERTQCKNDCESREDEKS